MVSFCFFSRSGLKIFKKLENYENFEEYEDSEVESEYDDLGNKKKGNKNNYSNNNQYGNSYGSAYGDPHFMVICHKRF